MSRKKSRPRRTQKEKRTSPAYPDPKTWREIVAQRDQILREFLFSLAEGIPDIAHDLVNRYGPYQVRYVLQKYQEYTRPSFLVDEAAVYRHYRWLFAQFGGDRPFRRNWEHGRYDRPADSSNTVSKSSSSEVWTTSQPV